MALTEMIGALGHGSALSGYTGPEMIFVMNHAPGAGSVTHRKTHAKSICLSAF